MGRRSKVDLVEKVAERCYSLYFSEKLTIHQAAEKLREEFSEFDGSDESVRRFIARAKAIGKNMEVYREQARIMMEGFREGPQTDLDESTLGMLMSMIFQRAMSLNIEDMKDVDVFNCVGKLVDAKTKVSKLRLDYNKGFGAAKAAVVKALKDELKGNHNDLLERLTEVINGLAIPETA